MQRHYRDANALYQAAAAFVAYQKNLGVIKEILKEFRNTVAKFPCCENNVEVEVNADGKIALHKLPDDEASHDRNTTQIKEVEN